MIRHRTKCVGIIFNIFFQYYCHGQSHNIYLVVLYFENNCFNSILILCILCTQTPMSVTVIRVAAAPAGMTTTPMCVTVQSTTADRTVTGVSNNNFYFTVIIYMYNRLKKYYQDDHIMLPMDF